jgi:AGZA family xanthine/uracil permease-like MFS transporter
VGIGLFIAFIGFQSAGMIRDNGATRASLGTLTSGPALLAVVALIISRSADRAGHVSFR